MSSGPRVEYNKLIITDISKESYIHSVCVSKAYMCMGAGGGGRREGEREREREREGEGERERERERGRGRRRERERELINDSILV